MASATSPDPLHIDISKRRVRVTGTRGSFVLFDFTIGDPDLTVELVLPMPAFREFRVANAAEMVVEGEAAASFALLSARYPASSEPVRSPA